MQIPFYLAIGLPANIYLFKFNNRNIRKRCKIHSKLTIKTSEQRHWRRSGVFIVNFEHILLLFLSVSIADFEQVNVSLVCGFKGALSGLRRFLADENPFKMMKNAFLFHLKSSFRSQDIFKVLSWLFVHV